METTENQDRTGYLSTMIPFSQRAGVARERLLRLKRLTAACRLCPRECQARRFRGETGECGLDSKLLVSSSHLHPGEEPVLSGWRGSGTVFFSGCNLACLFCQNYPLSQMHAGQRESPHQVAERFLSLEAEGAHNLNLVTPTPQLYGIFLALIEAWERGLSLPIVYNCGGYEGEEALDLLAGLVDIYLADLKYGCDEAGLVSGIPDYFSRARTALQKMQEQVGGLVVNDEGLAIRGLIVRHLVLPGDLSATREALNFLGEEISPAVYISLMAQYYPSYRAGSHPVLSRRLYPAEYRQAREWMEEAGLGNGWVQPSP